MRWGEEGKTDREKRREWGRVWKRERQGRGREGEKRWEEGQRGRKTERLTKRWLHRDRGASEGAREGRSVKCRPTDTVTGPGDEAHAEIGREGEEKRKKQRREEREGRGGERVKTGAGGKNMYV